MGFFNELGKLLVMALASGGGDSRQNQTDQKNREVNIQVMHPNGGPWTPAGTYTNLDGYLLNSMMENVQRQFPDYRVRAVDGHGRLLDML